MVTNYIPQRGDIVWLDFNPQAGHEQAGKRPALVLSPKAYNHKTGLLLACPITSRIKGYPFEVVISEKLPVKCVILADQIKSLDWQVRNAQFACQVSEPILADVIEKVALLLS
jgi:mRNA interferase MazF